ncbi:MAG: GNAT family N-acetyltransferase [Planctomycetota bacterium]
MTQPGLTIREGRADDAAAAGEMVARSRGEIYRVRRELLGTEINELAFPDVFEAKKRSTAELVRGNPRGALIAEVEGRMAGLLCWSVSESGEIGELREVTVDPEFQGRGIGTRMCRHALDILRTKGVRAVVVKTGLDDGHAGARRLYEKLGFSSGLPWIHYYQKLETLCPEANGDGPTG